MCTSCHMYIYIHTHAHTQFFKVEITKELIHYLLVDDPLPYKETQVWAFEWKSNSADDRRKGQAFAELPQQSNTKKRQHVEYKQLNFSLRPWRSKGSFFSIRATPPAVSLPPVGTKQIPPSLMSLPQPKWVPPYANSLISFKVCFVGSHWRHSKEPVTRGLKSFTTNCMIKLLKHACPLLILFCQHPFQRKIALLHSAWFIFHLEKRK